MSYSIDWFFFFSDRLFWKIMKKKSVKVNRVNSKKVFNEKWEVYLDEQMMNIDQELKEIDQRLEKSIAAVEAQ